MKYFTPKNFMKFYIANPTEQNFGCLFHKVHTSEEVFSLYTALY